MKKISMTLAMMVGMTGLALAGDAKAPAPAPTPKAPAPEAKKAPDAPKGPAKKAEPPKPATELVELTKVVAGTWNCTGKAAMDPADMTKMSDLKMKMTMKGDLDNFWILGTMTATSKDGGFKGTMHVTYDPVAKKFYRMMVDSWGGSDVSWSTGLKDNKVVWEGEGRGMGMATFKVRTTETMASPKEVAMTGEMSMDGKTWMKGWEATCKK